MQVKQTKIIIKEEMRRGWTQIFDSCKDWKAAVRARQSSPHLTGLAIFTAHTYVRFKWALLGLYWTQPFLFKG